MRIRLGLRDDFYNPTKDTQKAIGDLSKDLGAPVELNINWMKLWLSYSPEFADVAKFEPAIVHVAQTLLHAIKDSLANETWADELLEEMKKREKQKLDVYILPDVSLVAPKLLFLPHNASIALKITKAGTSNFRGISHTALTSLLSTVFQEAKSAGATGRADDDELDHTEVDDVRVPLLGTKAIPRVTRFPDVNTVSRPEVLMEEALPYYCTITYRGALEICCSHPRTLTFIENYISARLKTNQHTGRQWVKLERYDAWIGGGAASDRLSLSSDNSWGPQATPMPLLALIQHSLGYTLMHTDGSTWVLRRDTKFA